MPNGASPPVRPADLEWAAAWLDRHGLAAARPTPFLAIRLAARRRARRAGLFLLAVLIVAAGLTQAFDRLSTGRFGGYEPHQRLPLLVLAALVVGLVLAQALVDGWVRRVDRQAGATLSRRAAHPVQPGWLAMLGRPYAAYALAQFAGATMLGVLALTVHDSTVRYGALILLIGLLGVAADIAVQFRHLLARPVVADDEDSLTADVIMRIEDAREFTAPGVVLTMPVVLLFGDALGWWNVASIILVIVGGVTLHKIHARSGPIGTVARNAMTAR